MKHFVEYSMPGSFVVETTSREIESKSIEEAVEKAPSRAFCFLFYELPTVDFDYDSTRFRVTPIPRNHSGRYYLGGEVFTVEDIKSLNSKGDLDILISNAESNGWNKLIKTRLGNWQRLNPEDVVVPVDD